MDRNFPDGFLWGTATAAHQVEGNNVNSDSWLMEHLPHTIYLEPSGDACDQYHRYREDPARTPKPSARWLGNIARANGF